MDRLAKLLLWLRPGYFDIDLSAIQRLGAVMSRTQFHQEIENLHYVQNRDRGLLARRFPLGLSLDKLMQLEPLLSE